jgi:hypothetical protein
MKSRCLILILILAAALFGDRIVTKSGVIYDGKIVLESPGSHYKIRLTNGAIVEVKASDVKLVGRGGTSTSARNKSRTPVSQNSGGCMTPLQLPKTRRSSFGAAAMSCLIPGSGQFYNNNPVAGCMFGGFSAICWITFTSLVFSEKAYSTEEGNTTALTFLFLADIGIFASHLASAIHAGIVADNINAELGYSLLAPPMDTRCATASQQLASTVTAPSSSPSVGLEVTLLRF